MPDSWHVLLYIARGFVGPSLHSRSCVWLSPLPKIRFFAFLFTLLKMFEWEVWNSYHKCVGDMLMKKTFCLSGLMLDSNQSAQVCKASLYAVVTLYSCTSWDPYLAKMKTRDTNWNRKNNEIYNIGVPYNFMSTHVALIVGLCIHHT